MLKFYYNTFVTLYKPQWNTVIYSHCMLCSPYRSCYLGGCVWVGVFFFKYTLLIFSMFHYK